MTMGVTEVDIVLHTDVDFDELGILIGHVYEYNPTIFKWIVASYPYMLTGSAWLSPPIELPEPIDYQGLNISMEIIIRKEML